MEFCKICNHYHTCCPQCHCCRHCCCCSPPVCASFTVTKRNQLSETLAGAVYGLYRNGQLMVSSVSDATGILCFANLSPGKYELSEISPPDGYHIDPIQHQVIVDSCGNITIDGQSTHNYSLYDTPVNHTLSFLKIDAVTGLPLPSASFTLSNGVTVLSDNNGRVHFGSLPVGSYTMNETAAPEGYLPDPQTYQIEVITNQDITINGLPINNFKISEQPAPNFSFRKYDENNQPLPNAVFTLSNGTTATSDANGMVNFGFLSSGIYTMEETVVPTGYQPNPVSYTVAVDINGNITINGTPLSNFSVSNIPVTTVSERPVIHSVTANDRAISGTGIPGATITVTLPNGLLARTTVDVSGNWTVNLPNEITLQANDMIYANQTVPGLAPSEDASFLVQSTNTP